MDAEVRQHDQQHFDHEQEDCTQEAHTQEASIVITKRANRSTLMLILHTLVRPFASKLISSNQEWPAGSPQLEPHKKAKKRCNVQERRVEDIYLYDIVPRDRTATDEKTDNKVKRIYYFSGGGWQMPANSEHWYFVAELSNKLPNSAITLLSYPLAPNSPAETSMPQLLNLYRTLLTEASGAGEEVILAGDSAGGNIVLCLLINSLVENPDALVPKAVLAISPSTDLRRSNPDIEKVQPRDPILRISFIKQTAKAWRGKVRATSTLVSPLLASKEQIDLIRKKGVQVHGVTGGYDILGPDAILFRDLLTERGVRGEWLEWDKQMHVFPLAFRYGLRESIEAKDWIVDVLERT